MKVIIFKASDFGYKEIKEFKDWNGLMEYLKERYSRWILELEPEKYLNVDVEVWMYDDYVE